MSESAGKVNHYVCQSCKHVTKTVNRDAGVTPFIIRCTCGGDMFSQFYRVPQFANACGLEWVSPTPEERASFLALIDPDAVPAAERHFDNGGMVLRGRLSGKWRIGGRVVDEEVK